MNQVDKFISGDQQRQLARRSLMFWKPYRFPSSENDVVMTTVRHHYLVTWDGMDKWKYVVAKFAHSCQVWDVEALMNRSINCSTPSLLPLHFLDCVRFR